MPGSPFDDAYHLFIDESMPRLIDHRSGIGEAAAEGNELAKRILERYRLLSRSFEPDNARLLKEALDEWEATQFPKESTDDGGCTDDP